jgi:DNA-binding IclR family transcriptional regulator
MSKTLLRGLGLIEEVGLRGPLTVTELSRRLELDITIASRTVKACEQDGWLTRIDGKIVLGPRAGLLGLSSSVGKTVRVVEPIVRAVGGICGVSTVAAGLIGSDVMVLTSSNEGLGDVPAGLASRTPIHVMAAGRAIAAMLPTDRLDAVLPPEPFPGAEQVVSALADSAPMGAYIARQEHAGAPLDALAKTRQALDAQLDTVRSEGFARDHGELHPSINCIAAPWPGLEIPASLTCIGTRSAIEAGRALIERCLQEATSPGAGVQDVIRAAGTALPG